MIILSYLFFKWAYNIPSCVCVSHHPYWSFQAWLHDIITKLNLAFSLKHLGDLDYFLGIKVKQASHGSLLLTQTKYVKDLLHKTNMIDSCLVTTHMQLTCKLIKIGFVASTDHFLYKYLVGSLQYATITSPTIAYIVNKVCHFMAHPLESHWVVVKKGFLGISRVLLGMAYISPLTHLRFHHPCKFFVMLIEHVTLMTKE